MDPGFVTRHFSERLELLDAIDRPKVKISADAESSTRKLIADAMIICKGTSPLDEWDTYDELENYFNSLLTHVIEPRGTFKTAMDRAVQRILDNDPSHQAFLRRNKEMDSLRQGFDDHFNNLLHGYWEVMNLGDIGTPEPPKGKYNQEAHDRYFELLGELTGRTPEKDLAPAYAKLAEARYKLDNRHRDWMKEHTRPPADLEGWSPENE